MEAHDDSAPWLLRAGSCTQTFPLLLVFLFLCLDTVAHFFLLSPPFSLSFCLLRSAMASPRLETFCCPNRDAATEFVVTFQPVLFSALTLGSASLSLLFATLQLLPKRKGYRRLGQYPLPRPASSSRILFIISICDILGCAGREQTPVFYWVLRERWVSNYARNTFLFNPFVAICLPVQVRKRIRDICKNFFFLSLNLEFTFFPPHIVPNLSHLNRMSVQMPVEEKTEVSETKQTVLQNLKSSKTFGLFSFCSCSILKFKSELRSVGYLHNSEPKEIKLKYVSPPLFWHMLILMQQLHLK